MPQFRTQSAAVVPKSSATESAPAGAIIPLGQFHPVIVSGTQSDSNGLYMTVNNAALVQSSTSFWDSITTSGAFTLIFTPSVDTIVVDISGGGNLWSMISTLQNPATADRIWTVIVDGVTTVLKITPDNPIGTGRLLMGFNFIQRAFDATDTATGTKYDYSLPNLRLGFSDTTQTYQNAAGDTLPLQEMVAPVSNSIQIIDPYTAARIGIPSVRFEKSLKVSYQTSQTPSGTNLGNRCGIIYTLDT